MAVSLCACTVSSAVYASYGGKYEITENMYKYWTAYYKARFYSSFAEYGLVDGENYDESVWDQMPDGITPLSKQITDHVDKTIKEILICAELYDQTGLNKGKDAETQLKNTVDALISKDISAAGSRSALNAILGVYGMNTDQLRRVFEYEAKASVVTDKLFGEGGEYAVTDEEREQYYRENYHRAKHILIKTDVKYKFDDKGEPIINIYTGKYETEELTEEEKAEKRELAESILKRCQSGEDFEALQEEYNEDSGMSVYTDGYFVSADSLLDTKYMTAVITAETGETVIAETSYGLMIIKKYPLEAGMWKNEVNSAFFSDVDTNITEQKKTEVFGTKYAQISYNKENIPAFSDIMPLDSRLIYDSEE